MKATVASLALAAIFLPMPLAVNPCIRTGYLRVHGARELDTSLYPVSATGINKLTVHADDKTELQIDFSGLPQGMYRVTAGKPGIREYVDDVEVTVWKPWFFNRSLDVERGTMSCTGGISRGKNAAQFIGVRFERL